MAQWRPIEEMVPDSSIWVIKYDMFQYPEDHPMRGNFCDASTPNAQKFTDCHGWYKTEEEARKVRNHFRNPDGYRVERVWQRRLKDG